MMIKEIPGQATEGSMVSFIKCDHCWHLDNSIKMLAALTSAEANRCGWDCWLTLNNRRQSVGPEPDSRPCLEGVRYKYLTKLLTPTQPFLALHVMHTFAYIINQTPPLLG